MTAISRYFRLLLTGTMGGTRFTSWPPSITGTRAFPFQRGFSFFLSFFLVLLRSRSTTPNISFFLLFSHDDFNTVLNLPIGTHEFKFIVDGELRCSPDFPTVLDTNGNLINYVEVSPVQRIPLIPPMCLTHLVQKNRPQKRTSARPRAPDSGWTRMKCLRRRFPRA